MAFKLASKLGGFTPPFEYRLLTDAEAATSGEALVETAGRLTKCGAAATPEFIAMKTQAAEATAKTRIPVIRITELIEFETTMGAVNSTPAPVVVGTKLTLHTDGLSCSYVTTGGTFMLSGLANAGNAAVGDKVTGYFRR